MTNIGYRFINYITESFHAHVYLFVSFLNWNKCVCQNFGKEEIVDINGMLRFLFFRVQQLYQSKLSRSCFTNPTTDNFKRVALEEI
jgi:hypothetical protein